MNRKMINKILKNNPKLKMKQELAERLKHEKYLEDKKLEEAIIKRDHFCWEDGELINYFCDEDYSCVPINIKQAPIKKEIL